MEVIKSLVRVPAAITVFGVQQVQQAFGSEGTKEPAEKLCGVIDATASAVTAGIDEIQPAIDNISNFGQDVVRTISGSLSGLGKPGSGDRSNSAGQ